MTTPDITIGGWFAARVTRSGNRRALTFEGATLTYRELLDRVDRLAAGLRAEGLAHGDRVGFLGHNQPALLETMLAAARLGAVFVPLNFRLAGPELAFVIDDAGCQAIVVDAAHRPTIDEIADELPVRAYLGVDAAEGRWSSYEDLISSHEPIAAADPVDPEELAVIMYTSGTTGHPKGVMLSHANLYWNNINLMHLYDVHQDDVTLVASPMFHIAGLNVTIFTTWMKGGEVIVHRHFDPAALLADIERWGVTTTFGVPAMFNAVSQLPGFAEANLDGLRLAICGGSPVPEKLLRLYADRGVAMLQGYGLTETAPSALFLTAEHSLAKLGSVGQPPMFVEVKLVGKDGEPVAGDGARGEVCVRGPNVTRGYWNRPDATAAAIDADGWFHTGDVGEYDEDGFVSIVDRVKDMVITGGENVYPAEVENVLYEHPAIDEVAVIGLPDARWGEAVVAVAALRVGQVLTLEELRDFATRYLARYKLPTRLVLRAELPRNPAGKVLKFQLRNEITG